MMTQPLARLPLALTFALAALTLPALAQAQAQAPAASGGATELSVSERVKKDAAGPLYWIRLNAQKADAGGPAKPAPRITEVRAPRPAAAAKDANLTAAAPARPAGTPGNGAADGTAAGELAGVSSGAAAGNTPTTPGGALAGTAAAGLAPLSGPSATEAARAAAEPSATDPDDQPLALVKAEEPEFPVSAMRRLRKGTVQVRFEVQADGSVAHVAVVQTSHRSLNNAAIEAVAGWRFQPVRAPRSAVVDLGFDLDG